MREFPESELLGHAERGIKYVWQNHFKAQSSSKPWLVIMLVKSFLINFGGGDKDRSEKCKTFFQNMYARAPFSPQKKGRENTQGKQSCMTFKRPTNNSAMQSLTLSSYPLPSLPITLICISPLSLASRGKYIQVMLED
jgi:hypothetical protein